MIKIIVDAFGGDKSPIVNIEGAIQALNALSDLTIILVGDETILKKSLIHAPMMPTDYQY